MSRLTAFRKRHRHVRLPIIVRDDTAYCNVACPWFPRQDHRCEIFGGLRFDDGGYLRHNDCVALEDSDGH
jgi:hypothetical protein